MIKEALLQKQPEKEWDDLGRKAASITNMAV